MVNCSGSSRGAPNEDVDLASGRVRVAPATGLGAVGTGCALARGAGTARRISGVSEGLGEACFRDVGDFSGFAPAFVFFFVFGVASLAVDFFFGVASGVSFGVGAGVASSNVFFFAFAAGLDDSSGDGDAVVRAFRNCARFSSSVSCAWTNVPTIALSANRIASQNRKRPTVAQRNRAWHAINPEGFRITSRKIVGPVLRLPIAARQAMRLPYNGSRRDCRSCALSRLRSRSRPSHRSSAFPVATKDRV